MNPSPRPDPEPRRGDCSARGVSRRERRPVRDHSYERKMVLCCFAAMVGTVVLAALCVPQRPHPARIDSQPAEPPVSVRK